MTAHGGPKTEIFSDG